MWFRTSRVALTQGVGVGGSPINAFDNALRAAGIADFNLIKVSSIVPPSVPLVRLRPGSEPVSGEGLMVPTIYITRTSDVIGQQLSVAVGAGLAPPSQHAAGIVFVASCEGSEEEAREMVSRMVKEGMEAKGLAQHTIELASASTVARAPWSTALAAAVFCDESIERTLAHAMT
jgi:arginine decarboxylase